MESESLCMCMSCIEQTLYCFLGFTFIITCIYEQVFIQPIDIPFLLVYIGCSVCYCAIYFEFSRNCTTKKMGKKAAFNGKKIYRKYVHFTLEIWQWRSRCPLRRSLCPINFFLVVLPQDVMNECAYKMQMRSTTMKSQDSLEKSYITEIFIKSRNNSLNPQPKLVNMIGLTTQMMFDLWNNLS